MKTINDLSWREFVEQGLKPDLASGRLPSALERLGAYQTCHPRNWEGWLALGNLHRLSGEAHRFETAVACYQRARTVQPFCLTAYRFEAELHWEQGRRDEALECLATAIYLDKTDEALWRLYDAWQGMPPRLFFKPDVVMFTGHPLDRDTDRPVFLPYPDEAAAVPLGGSESIFLEMARQLAADGKKVALFGNFKNRRLGLEEGSGAGHLACLDTRDFFLTERQGPLPVVIVSRFFQPFLNPLKARRKIFWLHDTVTPESRPHYEKMDPQVDEYWALSACQQRAYENICGLAGEKFWRTTNAVDLSFFRPVPKARSERIPGRILYCSRPSRGLDMLLSIFDLLKGEFPHLTLKVCTYSLASSPEDDPEIRPYLHRLRRPDIFFESLGKIKLIREIERSEVMIYPNVGDLETSCLAVIESLAAGTPVITSDRGALSETVPEGKGLVLAWDDNRGKMVRSFCDAYRSLQDPVLWNSLSQAGASWARARHDSAVVAGQWLGRLEKWL